MQCKIDHTLEDAIPRALCRVCSGRTPLNTTLAPGVRAKITADLGPAAQARYELKQKRKLRAEVKAWRGRIEAMERSHVDPRDIAKAQETLARLKRTCIWWLKMGPLTTAGSACETRAPWILEWWSRFWKGN